MSSRSKPCDCKIPKQRYNEFVTGPGSVRTPIWDKAQAADVSAYKDTIYRDPLSKFVNHIVHEGKTSTHDPEYMARCTLTSIPPNVLVLNISGT